MSQLQQFPCSRPTNRHHVLRQAPLQLQEVALQRTAEKQARLFECCLASPSCIPLPPSLPPFPSLPILPPPPHTQSRSNFPVSGVHPNQFQQFLACIFSLLHRDNFVGTFRKYPCNLFTSGRQHEIFWQISSIYIVPESSSICKGLVVLKKRISGTGPAISSNVQLRIFSELFTKSLHNRCNQFWRIRVQQRILHFRVHPISFPNLFSVLVNVALQG